jgi:hypothetical protein
LAYGEYVLEVEHDENKNHAVDIDNRTKLPTEGIYILNLEKVDFSQGIEKGIESMTFDLLEFSFDEPEKTIEAKMMYPPFIIQSNK